jgi:DNA-binding CsgD family transcriptional regulator
LPPASSNDRSISTDPCGRLQYDRKTTLTRSVRRLWTHVAVHFAAGARLRSALERRDSGTEPQADAVLSPTGRIVHAEGEAKERLARESLRESAIAIDRARGRLRRSDPDAALDTWTGLVSGRWSLVDRFESDGRRYVVAHRNEAVPARTLALTLRERQVVGHILLGHSSKLTAYALGVSPSAVSGVLRAATQKLGVRSKAQLLCAFGDVAKGETRQAAQ